jgi:putative spermidine/putrescine transport system substrate-binding protein/putrescine transport system substrate-binding protein
MPQYAGAPNIKGCDDGPAQTDSSVIAGACTLCVQAADTAKTGGQSVHLGRVPGPGHAEEFRAQTGIQVVADHFDSLETVETKLLTGRSGYDLVLTAGQHLSRAIESGAIQPLDKAQVPHFAGVGEEFRQHMAVFDPGNRYAGIYAWGTTGVGFRNRRSSSACRRADRQLGDAV